jgi:hypothetical protein
MKRRLRRAEEIVAGLQHYARSDAVLMRHFGGVDEANYKKLAPRET